MKAQGLPINFIVIAALAILILILVVGFVVAGGSSFTSAVAPEQATSTCNSFCVTAQRSAAGVYNSTEIQTWKSSAPTQQKFCTATFDIKGKGKGITCPQLVGSCIVTFGDGTTYALDENSCTSSSSGS